LSTTRSPIRTVSRRSDHGVDPSARELAEIADLHPVVANERPKNIRILAVMREFQETIRQHSSLDFQPHAITVNEQAHCTVFSLA
jgi:hypothetical protein